MLVLDENRKLGDSAEVLSQVESMVKRDRNHPSVIMWMLCNEEEKQGSAEGRKRGETMKELILSLDPTRKISAAMNGGWGGDGLSNVLDVQGFNYNIWQYDIFRKKYPKMPCFGSETGSTVSTRGEYTTDKEKGYVCAYDVTYMNWSNTAEAAWKAIAERPYMAGAFVWTGFDYRGEPTPYDWPCINSHFGIMDTCGFPKDNFWYYKSWWVNEPVLHVFPHWNWPGRKGQAIDVWVHSNCENVELFLNGKNLGMKTMPRLGHLEWKVKYAPGVLSAKGYKDGQVVIEDKVETTGPPAKIRLKPYVTELKADGEDITPVEVEILDAEGRVVPTADNLVAFQVTGPAVVAGVGNGNPSSHERDKAGKGPAHRKAFNGLCMVLVGSTHEAGPVTITATSAGLELATAVLTSAVP
jgi:beta-galactosidase